MEPVPHRLEIVRNDAVVVIDDAFNSNPDGFSAALEVLASFPGRRILITPGMIELGDRDGPRARARSPAGRRGVRCYHPRREDMARRSSCDTLAAAGFPAERDHLRRQPRRRDRRSSAASSAPATWCCSRTTCPDNFA